MLYKLKMKMRQRQQNQTSLLCDSLLYQPFKRENEEDGQNSKREEQSKRYSRSCFSSHIHRNSQEEIYIETNQKSSKMISSVQQTQIDTDCYLHQSGNNELLLQTITSSSQKSITQNSSNQQLKVFNALVNQEELQKQYIQLFHDFDNLGKQLQQQKNYSYNIGQQNFLLKRRISSLQNQISCKNEQIDYLQEQLNRYEQMIANLHKKKEREIIKVIKEIPVYIQKQILIEVPIPIYINQKQQPKTYQINLNNMLFPEQNSFAINQLSVQMQKSQVNSDTKKSNFKFGTNCKSFQNMDLQEQDLIKQSAQQRNCGQMRQRRVKQIVQVPVYIEKQIIKEVEKEVIREKIIEKEVIIEKQVIRYIQIGKSQNQQQKKEEIIGEFIMPVAKKVNMKHPSLTQRKQIVLHDGKKNQQQISMNKNRLDCEKVFIPSASQCLLRIDQQSFQSNASNNYNRKTKKRQFSFDYRDQEQISSSCQEIIIQIPVQIQKIIYCDRQVLLPLEIPTEIIILKETIKEQVFCYYIPPIIIDKIIEVEKIIEKQVIVQKIIQKIVPLEIIVQNKISPQTHVISAHKNVSVDHKHPQQISIQLEVLKDYRIDKILVLEQQQQEHLRIDNFLIEQFVRAQSIVRAGQIIQIPVEIFINQKGKQSQYSNIHTQTNQSQGLSIHSVIQHMFVGFITKSQGIDQSIQVDVISNQTIQNPVQIINNNNGNRQSKETSEQKNQKIQIFVQKVVYIYEDDRNNEAKVNTKNAEQFSFVTFNQSPKQTCIQPQKPVSYQIIIQRIIQIEKPIEIIKEIKVEKIIFVEVPVQILVEYKVQKDTIKAYMTQIQSQTTPENINIQPTISNQSFPIRRIIQTAQKFTQTSDLIEYNQQRYYGNYEIQQLQIHEINSYAESIEQNPNFTERSNKSSQKQQSLGDSYDYSHFSPQGLKEKDDSELIKLQQQNQRYQQMLQRMNEQIRCTQDNMLDLGRKNDQLYRQIICLEQVKRDIETAHERYKESIEIKVERERNQLISVIQQQSKKRQELEGQYATIQKTLNKKEEQLMFQRNNVAFLDVKIKKIQKQKETQILQLVKQIQQRNQHISDLLQVNRSINEELMFYKQKQSKLIQQKSHIQEQLIDLRNNISEIRDAEAAQKIELEQKITQMFRKENHTECEDKVRYLQQFYKKEIEDINAKNTLIINHKMAYIHQLQASIKQKQSQNSRCTKNIQRNNQKINVKIINMQNQSKKAAKNQDILEQNKAQQLYSQNQRFLQVIQQLNHQISALNDQVNQLQQQLNKTYSNKQHSRGDLLCYSQYKQPHSRRNGRLTSIRVEQLQQIQFYHNMQDQYQNVIAIKNNQIDKLKKLLDRYQQVIQNLQKQVQYNQITHYQNASIHQDLQPSLQHERSQQFSNLLKKISLLEHKLRFQKIQKVKCSIQLRQCERIIQQYAQNQTQDHQKDIQLLEQLTYQYQQQRMKGQYLQRRCQKLQRDNMYLTNEIMRSNDNETSLKKSKFRMLMDDLEQIEAKIDKDFAQQKSIVRQYQIYRIKYFKVMELLHLIRQSVESLQKAIPKSCQEHLNCIKRYLAIIDNNQRNSKGNNSSSRQTGKISRVTIQQYNELSKEQEDELMSDLKKLDLNSSPAKSSNQSRVILKNPKKSTIQFQLITKTNLPKQIKMSLALKLIELGMNLITEGSLQYLNPQKLLINNYDSSDLTTMKLQKRLTFRNKKGFFQSPEVIKGQKQSSISYSWTIGLLIDFIFHSTPFYSSMEQITSQNIEDDYYFRDVEFPQMAKIVQQMVVKKVSNRASLETAFSKMLLISS